MSLRVVESGLYTLVVDRGRPRTRSLGVPLGGAADRTALALSNALVGNPPDAAALEFSLAGPTLEAGCSLACVVFGPPFHVTCGRRVVPVGKTFTLKPGEVLRISGSPFGMRGYFCVRGGFHSPSVLDSHSGLEPLRSGAELSCVPGTISTRFVSPTEELLKRFVSRPAVPEMLRVVDGPQADWFDADELYSQELLVSPASNRMGLRLQHRPLTMPDRELVSEPVCPGAVQVTRDGQCIVLGVDGQTIGGYPKIAQVISADLDRVGQLRPGDRITFTRISVAEATSLYRQQQAHLEEWTIRLRYGISE
jgi:5-oxoprolinase (ATP-hydrolysing) subunit C